MPTPRADLSASVVNDKIYLIGGKKYSSADPFFNETSLNEVYDPIKDSWSLSKPIPTAVSGYASVVVDTKIYIIGGALRSIPLGNGPSTSANQMFDYPNGQLEFSNKFAQR